MTRRTPLLLLSLVFAPSCSLIVEADDYTFVEDCTAGSEGCRCTALGRCDEGLECWLPGFCVVPPDSDGGAGESGGGAGEGESGGDAAAGQGGS